MHPDMKSILSQRVVSMKAALNILTTLHLRCTFTSKNIVGLTHKVKSTMNSPLALRFHSLD